MIVNEPEEVIEQWRLYIESLYDKDGKPKSDDFQVEEEQRLKMMRRGQQC